MPIRVRQAVETAHQVFGQTVVGDRVHQHAAGFLLGVIDCDLIAGPAQIVRGCQTGRAGTDDSGGFSGFSGGRLIEALAVFKI